MSQEQEPFERTRRAAIVIYAEVQESISDKDADNILERLVHDNIDFNHLHFVSNGRHEWAVKLFDVSSLRFAHSDGYARIEVDSRAYRHSLKWDAETLER